MKRLSYLFLAYNLLFSSTFLSANDKFYKSVWEITAIVAFVIVYRLYEENKELKTQLNQALSNQQSSEITPITK
jgi:hypothetical protein